jgi:hypothetical protein
MDFRALARSSSRVVPAAYALFVGLNAQAGPMPPQGQPTGVAAAFGNTVMARYPDGKYQRIWIRADGSWEAVGRRGKWSSGHWRQKGDQVCLKQSKPFPFPFSYCTFFPIDGGLGVKWASHDMRGEPIQITVVPGIQRP